MCHNGLKYCTSYLEFGCWIKTYWNLLAQTDNELSLPCTFHMKLYFANWPAGASQSCTSCYWDNSQIWHLNSSSQENIDTILSSWVNHSYWMNYSVNFTSFSACEQTVIFLNMFFTQNYSPNTFCYWFLGYNPFTSTYLQVFNIQNLGYFDWTN